MSLWAIFLLKRGISVTTLPHKGFLSQPMSLSMNYFTTHLQEDNLTIEDKDRKNLEDFFLHDLQSSSKLVLESSYVPKPKSMCESNPKPMPMSEPEPQYQQEIDSTF